MEIKKMEIKDFNIISYKNRLLKVDYKALEEKNGDSYKVTSHNEYTIESNKIGELKLIFSQDITLDPNYLFSLSIATESIIEYNLSDSFSEEDIKKFIDENVDYVIDSTLVRSHISLLIAQITSIFGRNPLLISPIPFK